MRQDLPLLEFDSQRDAVIEPSGVVAPLDVPPRCVLCFFPEVIARIESSGALRILTHLTTTIGRHPVYEWRDGERTIALVHWK